MPLCSLFQPRYGMNSGGPQPSFYPNQQQQLFIQASSGMPAPGELFLLKFFVLDGNFCMQWNIDPLKLLFVDLLMYFELSCISFKLYFTLHWSSKLKFYFQFTIHFKPLALLLELLVCLHHLRVSKVSRLGLHMVQPKVLSYLCQVLWYRMFPNLHPQVNIVFQGFSASVNFDLLGLQTINFNHSLIISWCYHCSTCATKEEKTCLGHCRSQQWKGCCWRDGKRSICLWRIK